MSKYLRVQNTGATVQVDDTYRNLAFRQRVTVTTTAAGDQQAGQGRFSLTVTGSNPVVAFAGAPGAILLRRTQSGNSFTFYGASVNAGTSFDVYVFDVPDYTGNGKYMVVRDASGKVIFDASQKYMKVVGMLSGENSASLDLPAGRVYVALQGVQGGILDVIGGPIAGGSTWQTFTVSRRITTAITQTSSGFTAAAQLQQFANVQNSGTGTPYPSPGTYGKATILCPILDVTYFT